MLKKLDAAEKLAEEIRNLVAWGDKANTEAETYYKQVGAKLVLLKVNKPQGMSWNAYVKEFVKIIVAQNCEEPGSKICTFLVARGVSSAAAKRKRESSQIAARSETFCCLGHVTSHKHHTSGSFPACRTKLPRCTSATQSSHCGSGANAARGTMHRRR
jgi:hypothetical protein